MTVLEPQVDFANMSDYDIAQIGLVAAMNAFTEDSGMGYTNNDSLAIVVGEMVEGHYNELGSKTFGPDGADFIGNIDFESGKLATAIRYEVDSITAYQELGDVIPEGPQRWTGAVHFTARVKTAEQGWMTRDFVGAASGVQGHFDMATVYTALTRMGACWAMQMQALFGKAS
jgi:hypothetical protein